MHVRRAAPGVVAVLIAAVVLWSAATASGAGFKDAAVYPVPAPPVVLVTGLDDSTPGMSPGGNCNSVGTMAAMCSALEQAGHKVYVVSSSSGSGAVIDNHAAFDGNASSLAHYLATVVKAPALLVGHSMGGILSRIAISRYGAASVGLFTIGAPHDGSFGADLVEGAAGLPCSGVICLGLQSAAKLILSHMGSGAVADLTQSARTADNANLSSPGVPTWTYAGTVCSGPDSTGYYFPNDGIVGRSSAFGVTANLGSTARYEGSTFHEQTLETVLKLICSPFSGTGTELNDPAVIGDVVHAAACVEAGTCGGVAHLATAGRARKQKHHKRRKRPSVIHVRMLVKLLSAHSERAAPGTRVTLSRSTSLIATSAFSANCNGNQVPALPALSGDLYGFVPGSLSCSTVTIAGPAPVRLGVLSDRRNVVARIVGQKKLVHITVSANGPIGATGLTSHGRTVHVIRVRHGAQRVTLTVVLKRASNTTISATVSGQHYAGKIPPFA
jgi:pimeloyl-ACP methyl ester carboxylesterase